MNQSSLSLLDITYLSPNSLLNLWLTPRALHDPRRRWNLHLLVDVVCFHSCCVPILSWSFPGETCSASIWAWYVAVNAASFSFHLALNIVDNSSHTLAIFLALFLPWLLYADWSFLKAIYHGTSPTPHARLGCSFIPSARVKTSSSLSGTKVPFATWACSARILSASCRTASFRKLREPSSL